MTERSARSVPDFLASLDDEQAVEGSRTMIEMIAAGQRVRADPVECRAVDETSTANSPAGVKAMATRSASIRGAASSPSTSWPKRPDNPSFCPCWVSIRRLDIASTSGGSAKSKGQFSSGSTETRPIRRIQVRRVPNHRHRLDDAGNGDLLTMSVDGSDEEQLTATTQNEEGAGGRRTARRSRSPRSARTIAARFGSWIPIAPTRTRSTQSRAHT